MIDVRKRNLIDMRPPRDVALPATDVELKLFRHEQLREPCPHLGLESEPLLFIEGFLVISPKVWTLSKPLSIEAVIVGRNDEYEPNWEANLFSAIAYNRRLFVGTDVDFRVAFVEWNPLPDRPLLAPRLAEAFSFARGIVVDPKVHIKLCTAPELQMLLTFAFNAGFRTTGADFCLGTCGDIFLGKEVARKITGGLLRESCLYRAERATIRNDLTFASVTPDVIEDPTNVVRVDTCRESPYDKPPYTNAAGDFSMLDTGTMHGIRGYDEGITFARLHIDARLGWTAMTVVDDCELLGSIYHINHSTSHGTKQYRTTGRIYNHLSNIPYTNPSSWGLAAFDWNEIGSRLYRVSLPSRHAVKPIPDLTAPAMREKTAVVAARVRSIREGQHPEKPRAQAVVEGDVLSKVMPVLPEWGSTVNAGDGLVEVETSDQQWAYACAFRLDAESCFDDERWYWVSVSITVIRGAIGIGLAADGRFLHEQFARIEDGVTEIYLPIDKEKPEYLILRNLGEGNPRARVIVRSAQILSSPKELPSEATR
ncbi:MAG: hypothetical protein ACRENA_06375 [Vulcanimicrobiaceae bacterium]